MTVWHQNSLALDKGDDLQQNSKEHLQVFLFFSTVNQSCWLIMLLWRTEKKRKIKKDKRKNKKKEKIRKKSKENKGQNIKKKIGKKLSKTDEKKGILTDVHQGLHQRILVTEIWVPGYFIQI